MAVLFETKVKALPTANQQSLIKLKAIAHSQPRQLHCEPIANERQGSS